MPAGVQLARPSCPLALLGSTAWSPQAHLPPARCGSRSGCALGLARRGLASPLSRPVRPGHSHRPGASNGARPTSSEIKPVNRYGFTEGEGGHISPRAPVISNYANRNSLRGSRVLKLGEPSQMSVSARRAFTARLALGHTRFVCGSIDHAHTRSRGMHAPISTDFGCTPPPHDPRGSADTRLESQTQTLI